MDDKATGIGCHWIPGTELYIGEVDGITRHGYGVTLWFTNSVLFRYEGEYDHNTISGTGSFFWRNGERYVGEYRNNLRNGHGIYYYSDGTHAEGTWVDDKFINEGEDVQHVPPEYLLKRK